MRFIDELTQVDIGVRIERHSIALGPLKCLLDLIDGFFKPVTLVRHSFISAHMVFRNDAFIAPTRAVASLAYRRAWLSDAFDLTLPTLQASC